MIDREEDYTRFARLKLTKDKRAGRLKVKGKKARFKVRVRVSVPQEMVSNLRHLANLRECGSVIAPETCSKQFEDVHHAITRANEFELWAEFDLETGALWLCIVHDRS